MELEEKYVEEYQAAQACYLHYDSFRWQSGSLIVAAAFVFWGFVLQSSSILGSAIAMATASFVVTALMTIWVLFAFHYRQLYLCKLNRVQTLERRLGFKQHSGFVKNPDGKRVYDPKGPKGHNLDLALYVLTSLTGIIFYLSSKTSASELEPWFLVSGLFIFGAVVATILYVLRNERMLVDDLKRIAAGDDNSSHPSVT
jgi:hypothetical protein